jgi:hypothetical protein
MMRSIWREERDAVPLRRGFFTYGSQNRRPRAHFLSN